MKSAPSPERRSTSRFLARVLPGAVPGPIPGFIPPCIPTLRDKPPAGSRWLHEIKFDGYRVQAHFRSGEPILFTRNGYDWTDRFARIAAAVRRLPVNTIVLDGEVIVQDAQGRSDMDALESDLERGRQDRFIYYAFDLLHLDGFNIAASPLSERKRVLAALLGEAGSPAIAYSEHLEVEGSEMFEQASRLGLEGIVSKMRDRPYRSGRSTTWLKVKAVQSYTVTIVGFVAKAAAFASLHVARRAAGKLVYAGRVGTGFNTRTTAALMEKMAPLVVATPPIDVPDLTSKDRWIRPVLQAEIEYRDVTEERILRHAVFKGLVERRGPVARREGRSRRRSPSDRPLLVIDGDSFAHRAYHALPKSIRRSDGSGGGAIVGFANYLVRFYESERPRAVLVGWDVLDVPTWRHKLFPTYQSGRKFDRDLLNQLDVLPRFVAACGFANAKRAGYEADDFLAAAVAREQKRGGTVIIASGDRDAFQLASEATTILHPIGAGKMARIGVDEVRERYGVEPKQVPDFIALRGDPSDRIPGARGVGAQGAANLLRRYPSLAAALADGLFSRQAAELRLYQRIATMDHKAPLPRLGDQSPDWQAGSQLAEEWGLGALAKRLQKLAAVG